MTNEIIELLPSADLKAKIKETNHQFKESELLEIIYTYAPTFDARLDLLGRFAEIASPDISALAKAQIEYEQETFARFIEASENVVYELRIKTTPDDWEENYLCASYNAALVCIDRFYEEYADINVKETEQTRYKILKRKIFSESDKFDADAPSECVLGPNKTVLEVSDFQNYFENFCEEKGICPPDSDDVMYPCFAKDLALIKYADGEEIEHFGVTLCGTSCKKNCGLIDYLYVLPLDGTTIRNHRFEDDFYDHDHIALPKVTLASPDDLDETMKKNYLDFVAYWSSKTQSNDEKKMKYYRISKYDPQYRIDGIYQKDEWTAISDIGKAFDGTVFAEDEYYKVEQSYVDFVLGVCNLQGIDHLMITDLENHNKLHWTNGQKINSHKSGEFIKLCLREEIWGRLVSKSFVFETGYEYYIHIGCELGFDEIGQLAHQNDLFVEEWEKK